MHTLREKGAGNIGCIFGLIVLLLVVIVAIKAVPAKVAVADFQDYCTREAEQGSLASDEVIHRRILEKAQSLKLPVTAEDIKVHRTGAEIQIEAAYDLHLKFPFYTYDWHVVVDVTRPLF